MSEDKRVLLPTSVKPKVYNLTLAPDFEKFVFDGQVDIQITVAEETDKISLHSLEITHNEVTLCGASGELKAEDISTNKEDQTATFTFDKKLEKGDYTLKINYQGILNDQMAGFYRSKYTDESGKEKWMGTTQFEPTDARKAFPCWDEPAIKAKFIVNIKTPVGYDALSNMPSSSVDKHDDGSRTFHFEETPLMSTYLLAFVVGEFECVEGTTTHGVKFRVWTPKGRKEEGRFALDVGMKILDYYEDWFDVKYPLPKQDMIAIADFAAGAMENWGLITYRETALLIDPKSATVTSKQRVAYVVAHELAHQWFGNLVTMQWWTDLWLNEGFATFVGNQAVDHLFPQWKVWTSFVSDYVFRAQGLDSMRSSHPIEVEINRSQEVDEIFDAISYCKGASVIRMIAALVGEQAFRDGLRAYLKKFAYGNTVTKDLWEALSKSSGKPVGKIMANWTQAKGFPVVMVKSLGKGKFNVSQRRFLSAGMPTAEEDKITWCINLSVKTDKGDKSIELYDREAEIDLGEVSWVKFNVGQTGFFRVQYDAETTKLVSKALEAMQLEPVDRLGIQNDVFALARSGSATVADALELSKAYSNETNYAVWSDLSGNLGSVSALFSDHENFEKYKKFILSVYEKIGKKLGWEENEGESDLDKLLRAIVLRKLGANGDASIMEEAKKRFVAYMKDPKSMKADLRSIILQLVGKNATPEEYDQFIARFKAAPMQEEKLQNLRAGCLAKDEALIVKSLDLTFSGVVRSQDLIYIYAAVVATHKGRAMAWDYLAKNWAKFTETLGGSFLLERMVSYVCGGFHTEEKAAAIEAFFKDIDTTRIARALAQSLEGIRTNAKFVSANKEAFAKFTASY